MALTSTTLSTAVAVNDVSIVVASATGFAAGYDVLVDAEVMKVAQNYTSGTTIPVLRGRSGTVQKAHVASAVVTVGVSSDFPQPNPGAQAVAYDAFLSRSYASYSAAGAIALPQAANELAIRVILGTSTLAMTVADPSKAIDGALLLIVSAAKSQSTITFATGIGNSGSSYDVLTLQNAGDPALLFVACNGVWCFAGGVLTGTSTALSAALS